MKALKKMMLLVKIGFLSVFGTSRGLENIEKELAFLSGEDADLVSKEQQSEEPSTASK